MNRKDFDYIFKVVVVGDSYIGKTTMLQKYIGNKEVGIQRNWVEKELTRNGRRVRLQIFDTMGLERFRSLTNSYYRGAKGCLVCFNKWKPQSFEHIKEFWLSDVEEMIGKDTPKILVGINRRKMENTDSCLEGQDIPMSEILSVCDKYKIPYMDVAMESAEDVEAVFGAISDLIITSVGDEIARMRSDSIQLSNSSSERHGSSCGC